MIKAINDFVILSERKEEGKSKILLSNVTKKRQEIFKVESVGDKVTGLKSGNVVVVDPTIFRELTVEGKKFFILKEKDIFAIIKK